MPLHVFGHVGRVGDMRGEGVCSHMSLKGGGALGVSVGRATGHVHTLWGRLMIGGGRKAHGGRGRGFGWLVEKHNNEARHVPCWCLLCPAFQRQAFMRSALIPR